jgi:hypothetical protein
VVEDDTAATTTRRGRFARRDRRVEEPAREPVATTDGTTERRV